MGQTWHPLFGDVSPQILNLSVGAPFQPFSRAPQIRYQYTNKNLQLTGAAIWQSQYLSVGPDNVKARIILKTVASRRFMPEQITKEKLVGRCRYRIIIHQAQNRIKSGDTGIDTGKKHYNTYKVNERITTLSYEAHLKYSNANWLVAAKSVLGSNLTQTSMLGGYGIKSKDAKTGKQEYASILNSSSWVNVVYGKKWKPGVFLGYIKNLGTGDSVTQLYGTGTDVDQLTTVGAELTYNVAHWKFGLEYTFSSAWYGSMDTSNGKIKDTHSISNHRVVGVAMFMF